MKKNILRIIGILIFIIIFLISLIIILANFNDDRIAQNTLIDDDEEICIAIISDEKKIYNFENMINYYVDDLNIAAEESLYESSSEETEESIMQKKLNIGMDKKFSIRRLSCIQPNNKNDLYFAEGYLIPKNIKSASKLEITKQQVILTITIDKENNTFTILPYKEEYSDIINYQENVLESTFDKKKIKQLNKTIENKYYNTVQEKEVTNEEIAQRYYEEYRINALYYPMDAYKMLDDDYKKERFPSFEKYSEYLEQNSFIIEDAVLTKYSVKEVNGYGQYFLVDTYQNFYTINKTDNPMDFKILLDDYTVRTDEFKQTYMSLSEEEKVATNVHIFIQMLNTRDYDHAYNILSNDFKKNNFSTIEKFKEYVNKNLLQHYIETDYTISQEGSYYIYNSQFRDSASTAANIQEMNIIMKLKDNMDFEVSFNLGE